MTSRKTLPTESGARNFTPAEQAEAYARARVLVKKQCTSRPSEWREDVAGDAFTSWLKESNGAPVDQWVRRAIVDASRRERRDERASARADDLKRATLAHDSSEPEGSRTKRFTRDEEPELKLAVRRLCLTAYEATWGHPWTLEYEAAWQLLEGMSADHAAAERQARAAAAELIEALARSISCIDQAQPTIEGKPTRGGYAVKALFDVRREVRSLLAQIPTDMGVGGYLDSRLHSFVAAALSHDGFRRALGCTRPLDVNELTVVWILSGGWSEIRSWDARGITAKFAIYGIVKRAVRQARAAYLGGK